ncbi:MAG TPA: hypothetical protein VGU43_05620 [Thermoplasmata archaeon]|nr:hypothetical protein [Thermoplasmata archaeon]
MRSDGPDDVRLSAAFAPGHVTGIFAPSLEARDPRGRGSVGAGLVLPLGVRASARWTPGGASRLTLASDLGTPLPISEEVGRRLLSGAEGHLEVFLVHELPVGRGLGMSAAGALATALVAAQALGRPRAHAVEVAHLADLYGGGGLGGVGAILGGGLELRLRAGLPPRGIVRHRPFPFPVWVATLGAPLLSRPLLQSEGFRERTLRAAGSGLEAVARAPTPESFLSSSEEFTDALRLASPPIRRLIRGLRATGARAAQAMLGRTIFAVAPTPAVRRRLVRALQQARLHALELRVPLAGARPTRVRRSIPRPRRGKGL